MARAGAAAVLALAVCCLLVATAPARRPAELDREAAAEPLLPKPVGPADCGEAADQGTAIALREEEGPEREEGPWPSSLLCLVFRCGDEPAGAGRVAVARGGFEFEEQKALEGSVQPAVAGKASEAAAERERPYDSDSDCDSDSDDEDEGGFLGWLWSLADRF